MCIWCVCLSKIHTHTRTHWMCKIQTVDGYLFCAHVNFIITTPLWIWNAKLNRISSAFVCSSICVCVFEYTYARINLWSESEASTPTIRDEWVCVSVRRISWWVDVCINLDHANVHHSISISMFHITINTHYQLHQLIAHWPLLHHFQRNQKKKTQTKIVIIFYGNNIPMDDFLYACVSSRVCDSKVKNGNVPLHTGSSLQTPSI